MNQPHLVWNYLPPPAQDGGTHAAPLRPIWAGCGSAANPCKPAGDGAAVTPQRTVMGLGSLGGTELGAFGDDPELDRRVATYFFVWRVVAALGMGLGAFHGYRRSRGSVASALGWGVLGFLAPVITIPVAVAQGLGKPK